MAEEREDYDLADDAPAPRPPMRNVLTTRGLETLHPPADAAALPARSTPGVPAAAARASTLSYARPGTMNSGPFAPPPPDSRGGAADPLLARRERRRRLIVPSALIITGTLVVYGCAWGITGSLPRGAVWASVSIGWDLVVTVIALLLGARLVDLEVESIPVMLLQVTAIILASAAVFWPIMWVDHGAFCGALVAWIFSTLVYCALLGYFFELDLSEVIPLALVIVAVHLVANLPWIAWFGWWGYLPA